MDDLSALTAELEALNEGCAVAAAPDLSLWRLEGPDPLTALDRVVSQKVGDLAPGAGVLSLLLAPKGQFRGLMAVFATDAEPLVLVPAGRGRELADALGRYLGLSRCRLVPVDGGAVLVLGPEWRTAAPAELDTDAVAAGGTARVAGARWVGRTFVGVPGAAVWADDPDSELVRRRAAGGVTVSADALGLARIMAGEPAWGAELTDRVLPPEVGIETDAVSYTKGCYVGQETMARMQTYGHPNRALVQLRGSGVPATLPADLVAEGEEKPRGTLTSWGVHPSTGGVGLALVRRELAEAGRRLRCGDLEVEVVGPAVA